MTYQSTAVASTNGTSVAPTAQDLVSSTPKIRTAAYDRSEPRWAKCRALMHGIEAIREGGTLYLPQHANENDARYEVRKVIAGLFNGFARTVDAVVGLLVQQEPVLGEDMPQQLVDMWENIDGCGTHGAVFTKRLLKNGVVDGFAGIVTEYPRANDPRIDRSKASMAATIALETGAPLDAADEVAMGLNPYFIAYKADEILLPLYETVNGKRTLVLLILQEHVTERKGRFGLVSVTRYRVYELVNGGVSYERWTSEQNGEPIRDEGPTPMRNLTAIPWSPFIAGEELEPGEYKPPLMDLADLNIEHHNIKTNILSLVSLACVPTPVRIGVTPTIDADGELVYPPLVLGPGNTIEAPAVQGVSLPVYWLSPPIDVLEPASRSLENCTAEMGAMGASFLVPQPRMQETATAHIIDSTSEKASVSSVGRAAQDCLESAFGFAGQYIKQPGGSVTLNQQFESTTMDAATLTAYARAVADAGLPVRVFLAAMQKGKLIDSGEDLETLEAEMMSNQSAIEDQKAEDAAALAATGGGFPSGRPRKLTITRGEDGKASGIEESA